MMKYFQKAEHFNIVLFDLIKLIITEYFIRKVIFILAYL